MKAAVYHGIEDIRIEEVEKPVCGEREILIKVSYCAICGTDVRIFFHGHKKVNPPAIIGHEITGIIEEIGKKVDYPEIKVGDRVTVVTSIGCGKCKMCLKGYYNLCPDTKAIGYYYQGGYAEYLLIPEISIQQKGIVKLPDNLSLSEGALIEPLSCCINGQSYLNIEEGDTVVIYGGGPIGLMHANLAKSSGADKVIVVDPDYERLEKFGKQFEGLILWDGKKVNVKEEINKITDGYGADVVITACPAKQAQMEGIEILGSKGRISLFGGLPKDNSIIQIDANLIHYKELSVFGAYASNKKDYIKAAELISEGKIEAKKFISEIIPLEKIKEGINMIKNGEVLKVVVEINPD
ncbi:zinc-dependent dehydrogenase [bacterium]|nr:zinc-dependent dehydrogenase [bacterium]